MMIGGSLLFSASLISKKTIVSPLKFLIFALQMVLSFIKPVLLPEILSLKLLTVPLYKVNLNFINSVFVNEIF